MTIRDNKLRRLMNIYFRSRKPCMYCRFGTHSDWNRTEFTISIPEVIETLKEKNWRIESRRRIYVPLQRNDEYR